MSEFPKALSLAAESLIVVAPHPDDDVLGCGALIARISPRIPVRVIYITDGSASHHGSPTYPPARLREVREGEARLALRRLGVCAPPVFLRWPDGTVPHAEDAAAQPLLVKLRAAISPDEDVAVAVPWRRDHHRDHRATHSLLDAVLRERPRAERFEYAVWLGIIGEAGDEPAEHEGQVIEIDSRPWLSAKRDALGEHRSQLGGLITDAAWQFELPEQLLVRALGPVERFVIQKTGAAA